MNSSASPHPVPTHHIVPVKYYIFVFGVLIFLTLLTVTTAKYVDLGNFNFALAMGIAVIKGILVLAIFMGLLWDRSGFNVLIIVMAILFFSIFIGIIILDYTTRDSIYPEEVIGVDRVTKLRVDGYFLDLPKGADIPLDEFLKLKNETDPPPAVLESTQDH